MMRKVIQVARNAPVLVANGKQAGDLEIWDVNTCEKVTGFHTVYDDCARFAIDSTGNRVVAANWKKGQKGGVACYDTISGDVVWHRTDLGQVQHAQFSAVGNCVWCEVANRPLHCLDAKTGLTLKTLRAVRDAVDSPYSPHTIFLREADYAIGSENESAFVPRLCRSGLVAAFSPDAVCVCEAFNPTIRPVASVQGVVRCLELNSGNERWRYQPSINRFMPLISFHDDHFYGVQSESLPDGWAVSLIRLSPESGKDTEVCRLPPPPYFGGFGSGVLVTPEGDVVSLHTGGFISKLIFAD